MVICWQQPTSPGSPTESTSSQSPGDNRHTVKRASSLSSSLATWVASPEWVSLSTLLYCLLMKRVSDCTPVVITVLFHNIYIHVNPFLLTEGHMHTHSVSSVRGYVVIKQLDEEVVVRVFHVFWKVLEFCRKISSPLECHGKWCWSWKVLVI